MSIFGEHFRFSGRLERKKYWLKMLHLYFIWRLAVVSLRANNFEDDDYMQAISAIALAVTTIILFALVLSGHVRRLHDRDHSGWLSLVLLVPVVGWIWFIYETAQRGTIGENRFGPDPIAAIVQRQPA